MSNSPENLPSSPLDTQMSRRSFLKLGGAVVGAGVLLNANIPFSPVAKAESKEASDAPTSWGVDLVEGEPSILGEVVLPKGGVFELENTVNRRQEPNNISKETLTSSGALFEGVEGEEDLKATGGDTTFRWTGGNLIYENEQLVTLEHAYVANNQGFFHYIEDPNDLPPQVQEKYRVEQGLPIAWTAFDVAQFDSLFDKVRAKESDYKQFAASWGKTIAEGEQPFEDTAVGAWQRSVTSTALFAEDTEEVSDVLNICSITGAEGEICNYSRYIDPVTGMIDVVTRFNNPNDKVHPEVFVITRFGKDKKVIGIGTTTGEGLSVAYGKDAPYIVQNTTAFTGDQVVDVVQGINTLDQSRIFLPALHRENQLAPKFQGTEGLTHNYERVGDMYYAVEIDSTGKELKRSFYIQGENIQGEWINAPHPEGIQLQIERFTKAFKMREDEFAGFGYEQFEINGEKVFFAHTTLNSDNGKDNLAGKIPLLKAMQDKSGEWHWTTVVMRDIADAVNMKIGTVIEEYTKRYLNEMNMGVCYQEWGYGDNIKDTNYRKGLGFQSKIKEYVLTHIIEPAALPAEAATWTATQAEEEIKKRVQEAMSVPGIEYYSIINEPGTVGGRVDQLERIFGDKRYIEIACNEARRVNPDAKLLLNDTINQTELARRLYGQGLIDGFGDQKHILQYSSQTDQQTRSKQALIDEFVAYGMPIMITELDINQTWMSGGTSGDKDIEQAKIARTVVDAAIESGVVIGINLWGMGDQNSWLVNENLGPSHESSGGSAYANPTPIDAEGNRKAFYFALTQGMYEAARSKKSSA